MPQQSRVWVYLLVGLILLGAACRLRQYLARTSFWNDEAFVVLNVVDHSARQLLGPLDYNQAAPPAFLWIERGGYVLLGSSEYALRLFPLLSGLAALAVFAALAWRALGPWAAVFATGWFAVAEKLVSYSAEVKQYSSDALVAAGLLFLALGTTAAAAPGRFLWIASTAAVAVWLSHPAVIIFAALSLGYALPCFGQGWRGRIYWLAGNLLVLGSFAALYRLSIVHEQDPFLYRFWADGFPPRDGFVRVLSWLGAQLYELARQPFPPLAAITAALAILGIIALIRRRRIMLLAACVGPIVLTILVALDRKYPFSPSRLTIFLLPGLLLVCGAGAGLLISARFRSVQAVGIAVAASVLGYGIASAGGRLVHPHFRSHIRPVVDYVRSHRQPGEALFLLGQPAKVLPELRWGRHLEFYCYWRNPPPPVSSELPGADELPRRFWIIYPFEPGHPTDFIRPALDEARSAASQTDAFIVRQGGAAYRFERRVR